MLLLPDGFDPAACRATILEAEGRACGGRCWTSTCPLPVQAVRLAPANAWARDLSRTAAAVGWEVARDLATADLDADEAAALLAALAIWAAHDRVTRAPPGPGRDAALAAWMRWLEAQDAG